MDRPPLHPLRLRLELPRARRAARRRRLVLALPPRQGANRPARRAIWACPPDGYQGNWIPHQLRAAVEDEVFFAGDSAGHCLPLTAEGIRTALYFGLACGRELRTVLDGRSTRAQALARYGAFSAAHERKYRWLLNTQRAIGRLTPSRAVTALALALESRRVFALGVRHYLAIAPPIVRRCEPTHPAPTDPTHPFVQEASRDCGDLSQVHVILF